MLNHKSLLVIAGLVAIIVWDAMCSPQLAGGRPNGFGRPTDPTGVSPAYSSDTSIPASDSSPLPENAALLKGGDPNVYNGRPGGFPGGFGRHDPHAPFATSLDPSATATSTPAPSSEAVDGASTSVVTMSTTTTAPRANGGVLTATITLGAPQATGSIADNDTSSPLPHLPEQGLPLDTIGEVGQVYSHYAMPD